MKLNDVLYDLEVAYKQKYRTLIASTKDKFKSIRDEYKEDRARELIKETRDKVKAEIEQLNQEYIKEYEQAIDKAKSKIENKQWVRENKVFSNEALFEELKRSNKIALVQARLKNAREGDILELLEEYGDDKDVIYMTKAIIRGDKGMMQAKNEIQRLEKGRLENQLAMAEKQLRLAKAYLIPFDTNADPHRDLGAFNNAREVYFSGMQEK